MKFKHITAAAATAFIAFLSLGLTSCDEELDRPPIDIPVSSWEANTTILDLKTRYWQSDRNFATEIVSPQPGGRVIIGCRVIASDSTGNIYKTVYLQDATSAVAIAVDTTKLYLKFKQGEQMFFDVTGLYAGKYADSRSVLKLRTDLFVFLRKNPFRQHIFLHSGDCAANDGQNKK